MLSQKKGYSKVGGSYTGNGNANGTFVYTGFKPSFVIIKRTMVQVEMIGLCMIIKEIHLMYADKRLFS